MPVALRGSRPRHALIRVDSARTVWSDDRGELGRRGVEVDGPQDRLSLVGDGQGVDREGVAGRVLRQSVEPGCRRVGCRGRYVGSASCFGQAAGRGGASEGADDGRDVMVEHAEPGSFVGAGRAGRVGEEGRRRSTTVWPRAACAGDEGLDVAVGDGGLDEDGSDVSGNEQINQVLDVPDAGLRLGGQALDGVDLDVRSGRRSSGMRRGR
jgi:hypothetical protein